MTPRWLIIASTLLLTGCPQEPAPPAPGAPPESVPEEANPTVSILDRREPGTLAIESAEPIPDVPVRMTVVSSKTQYLLGEPVQLFVLFENRGRQQVILRGNFFLDRGMRLLITPANGRQWQFIDRLHTGISVPVVYQLPPGGSRGFYEFVAHAGVGEQPLPFPEPGFYRIDVQTSVLLDDSQNLDYILAEPVHIEILPPPTPADQHASEILLDPAVASGVQALRASPEVEESLRTVIATAPESVYAEHAHFLLATIEMERQSWLRANEHLYPVYERVDGYYPKDIVLGHILSNFDAAGETERAMRVGAVMRELWPTLRPGNNQLLERYLPLSASPEEPS